MRALWKNACALLSLESGHGGRAQTALAAEDGTVQYAPWSAHPHLDKYWVGVRVGMRTTKGRGEETQGEEEEEKQTFLNLAVPVLVQAVRVRSGTMHHTA